jgi:hypothetical protein
VGIDAATVVSSRPLGMLGDAGNAMGRPVQQATALSDDDCQASCGQLAELGARDSGQLLIVRLRDGTVRRAGLTGRRRVYARFQVGSAVKSPSPR